MVASGKNIKYGSSITVELKRMKTCRSCLFFEKIVIVPFGRCSLKNINVNETDTICSEELENKRIESNIEKRGW